MKHFKSAASIIALIFLATLGFVSCKDDYSEKDALDRTLAYAKKRDSIANAQTTSKDSVIVNLTILSYPSNSALANADVAAVQFKNNVTGKTQTDGSFHFKTLKGSLQLQLQAADHAGVSFQYNYDMTKNAPVVFITARLPKTKTDGTYTLQGSVYGQFDLNSTQPYSPAPAGIQVSANMTSTLQGYVNYFNDVNISNVILSNIPSTTVQATTDQNGKYSLAIPVVTGAVYNYRIDFADFTHNQRLAINRFLDGTEVPTQHNLFGDFSMQDISTSFTTQTSAGAVTSYTVIPSNVPVFKVEVVQNPTSGTKPLYTAAVVSTSNESSNNGLAVGRIFSLVKISGDGVYPYNTAVTFRITDLRDGTTADVQFANNYYYYGSSTLPNVIQMGPNYNYYYNYAPSPTTSFKPGLNAYNSVVTPLGSIASSSAFTTANYSNYNGQFYNSNQRTFGILTSGAGLLSVDGIAQRYFVTVSASAGVTNTLDVNYGTGIKSRPVE